MRLTERQRSILWIAAVATAYFVASRLSLLGAVGAGGITPIWPPTGIFVSAILLSRRETRPWMAGVLFMIDLVAELHSAPTTFVGVGYAIAESGDAILGAWLILRFVAPSISFVKVREVFGYLLLSVVLTNFLASLLAAAVSTRAGASFWETWRTFATSDGMGNLLVTPFVIAWARIRTPFSRDPARVLEGFFLMLPMAILTFTAFGTTYEHGETGLLLSYLAFPLLLWAALRFDLRLLTSALVVMATVAVASAVLSSSSASVSVVEQVIFVQLFLATMAIPSLVLSANVAERKGSLEALGKSEALLSSVLSGSPDAVFAKDPHGRYLLANDAAVGMIGKPLDEIIGKDSSELFPERDAAALAKQDREVMDSREPHTYKEDLRLPDGQNRTVLTTKGPLLGAGDEILGVVAITRDITEFTRSQEERDRLRERMVNAQEEERRRIAADIHDDSIQQMTAVGLRLGALRHLVASGGSDDATFASLEESVEKAITRLRHLMFELRPPALDEQGLVAAIVGYVGTESRSEGFRFDLRDRLDEEPDPSVRAGLYRIVQEAVRNVSKHAEANSLTITVSSGNGRVILEIQDDGKGFGKEQQYPDHFGLAGIRERASMMGGSATVESSPGAGTIVKIWVPSHHGSGSSP